MNITTPTQKELTFDSVTELPSCDDKPDDGISMLMDLPSEEEKIAREVLDEVTSSMMEVRAEVSAGDTIGCCSEVPDGLVSGDDEVHEQMW